VQRATSGLVFLGLLLGGGTARSTQTPPPTFPSEAQVVVLDVIAKDRKGRPVDDLRPGELQVFEDGRRCEIRSLRLVRAGTETETPASPRATAVPQPDAAPAPPSATPTRPSLVVLVFDRFTNEWALLARKGALDFLSRSFPPDTWFAVFKVDYGLRLLAPFTTDPKRLRAAVERATSGDREKRVGTLAPELPGTEEQPDETVRPGETTPRLPHLRDVAGPVGVQEEANADRLRALDSLYALLGVTRALSVVEGRKAIIYFSDAWHHATSVLGPYEDVVSEANRANVAINTVDARGLTTEAPFVATLGPLAPQPAGRASPPQAEAHLNAGGEPRVPLSTRFEVVEDRLTGPNTERLADDTGGLPIGGTNDLGAGLAVVAGELRQYYELVYVPANPSLDGRFRHVSVEVSRPGVRLRTRAGYFAVPRQAPRLAARELPLMTALAAETPPHDFALRAGVLHFAPAGAERQCVLVAEVPLSEVEVAADEANDTYRAHLAFLARVKDADGRVIARLTHDWPLEGPLPDRDKARERNAVFRRTLSLVPGRYELETAVQDRRTGALSASRTPFEVPPFTRGVSLGSVTVLRRAEPAAEDSASSGPLAAGGVLLFPDLEGSFVAGSRPELPLFVSVYPAADGGAVELTVELRRGGQVVASATTGLPTPGLDGRIPWFGGIPSGRLAPGSYEIDVTARQGETTARERTRLEVEAPGTADTGRPPK
jgi:VWFA-related protein